MKVCLKLGTNYGAVFGNGQLGPRYSCRSGEKTSYIMVRGILLCQNMYVRPQNGPGHPKYLQERTQHAVREHMYTLARLGNTYSSNSSENPH